MMEKAEGKSKNAEWKSAPTYIERQGEKGRRVANPDGRVARATQQGSLGAATRRGPRGKSECGLIYQRKHLDFSGVRTKIKKYA